MTTRSEDASAAVKELAEYVQVSNELEHLLGEIIATFEVNRPLVAKIKARKALNKLFEYADGWRKRYYTLTGRDEVPVTAAHSLAAVDSIFTKLGEATMREDKEVWRRLKAARETGCWDTSSVKEYREEPGRWLTECAHLASLCQRYTNVRQLLDQIMGE